MPSSRGLEALGKLTFLRSYSKNGKEAYADTVERYLSFWRDQFPMLHSQITGYGDMIHQRKIVGSQRMMQFAGPAVNKDPQRAYNCAFLGIESFKDFADICHLLCCGCGVGVSVEQVYVDKLTRVQTARDRPVYSIADSKEGWADSFLQLFVNPNTIFNYLEIRAAGTRLSSGGTAGGPGPLRIAHEEIRKILQKAEGRNLNTEEVADCVCLIAQAVVSGGTRRSAIIILSDPMDPLMSAYKTGDWWNSKPYRAKANISAVCTRGTGEVEALIDEQLSSPFGERGIVLVTDKSTYGNKGVNPCAEVSLRSRGFCNLSSIIVPNLESSNDFLHACRSAAFFNTLQATLTDFSYIHPEWKHNAKEDGLIGVSMTGIAQAASWFTDSLLCEGVEVIKSANINIAKKVGIKPSKRLTTEKPEGSTSCVFGVTSGMHAAHFEYGVRRIRVTKLSPLGQKLIEMFGISDSELVETPFGSNFLPKEKYRFLVPECYGDTDIVLQFPCHYQNAVYRKNETALDALARASKIYEHWIKPGHLEGEETNNVSQTLNFRLGEKEAIKKWMLENQDKYRAISTLPYDCEAYALLPFEETSYEEYLEYLKNFPDIDFETIMGAAIGDNDKGMSACNGGSCEISSL